MENYINMKNRIKGAFVFGYFIHKKTGRTLLDVSLILVYNGNEHNIRCVLFDYWKGTLDGEYKVYEMFGISNEEDKKTLGGEFILVDVKAGNSFKVTDCPYI